jgi:hypothetical protein
MQARVALAEFNFATTHSQRVVALNKLRPLFEGEKELKRVLRKCLALTRRFELLSAEAETAGSSVPVSLPTRSQ